MRYYKHSISVSTTAKRKNGAMSIVYRVSYISQRDSLYSGIAVTLAQWNTKKQQVRQGCIVNGVPFNIINSTILSHIEYIDNYFNDCELRDCEASLQELKDKFNHEYKLTGSASANEFFYAYDKFIETTAETRRWTTSMLEKNVRIRNILKEMHPNLRFSELTEKMLNTIVGEWSQTLNNDSLKKRMYDFRRFLRWAEKNKYGVNKDCFSYEPKFLPTHKDVRYLTIEELNRIRDLDLQEESALDRVRDMFLFQCGTALRYSDLQQLRKSEIQERSDGTLVLQKLTEKDDDVVVFPLCAIARKIYEKYKNNVYPNGVMFPVISNQKYNKHLKEIGVLADLQGEWVDTEYRQNNKVEHRTPKRDLESHTARRTFICIAINEGVPSDLVAQVTSHSDIKAMKPYIKVNLIGTKKVMEAIDRATSVDKS